MWLRRRWLKRFIVLPCIAAMIPKHCVHIIHLLLVHRRHIWSVPNGGMSTFFRHKHILTLAVATGVFHQVNCLLPSFCSSTCDTANAVSGYCSNNEWQRSAVNEEEKWARCMAESLTDLWPDCWINHAFCLTLCECGWYNNWDCCEVNGCTRECSVIWMRCEIQASESPRRHPYQIPRTTSTGSFQRKGAAALLQVPNAWPHLSPYGKGRLQPYFCGKPFQLLVSAVSFLDHDPFFMTVQ